MLPPDTMTDFVPWRVLVTLMQLNGCFPYKLSPTGGPAVFSLPLCLWGIFLFFSTSSICLLTVVYILQSQMTPSVGSTTYAFTCVSMMLMINFSPVAIVSKSKQLAELFHELSEIKEIPSQPSRYWYCRPKILSMIFFVTLNISLVLWYVITTWGITTVPELLSIIFMNTLYSVNILLPERLSFMVFDLLGRRLVVATESTVARVSMLLAPDGSFKNESNEREAMLALRDLDAIIREVELQREKGTRCFLPVITMFLGVCILLAICSPYAIKNGIIMGGSTIFGLLLAVSLIHGFYRVGQAFIRQVREAEGHLKSIRVTSQSFSFSMKVSQVMGSLSSMFIFDVCDWYTLDYVSFLGLMNTVVTYVVIIFQVGDITVDGPLHGTRTQNNSTDQ